MVENTYLPFIQLEHSWEAPGKLLISLLATSYHIKCMKNNLSPPLGTECHPKNDHTILTHLDNSSTTSMKISTSSKSLELFCCSLLCPTSYHRLPRPVIYLFHQINLNFASYHQDNIELTPA